MAKNILILNGSPKKNGNTSKLVEWFVQGARLNGGEVEIIRAALLSYWGQVFNLDIFQSKE
ncbi:MAG: NAD(P)H-dependent oxidoreductase [bacterium]|nr:NAD(P)H-dependent oxidoreductase [bacterium]